MFRRFFFCFLCFFAFLLSLPFLLFSTLYAKCFKCISIENCSGVSFLGIIDSETTNRAHCDKLFFFRFVFFFSVSFLWINFVIVSVVARVVGVGLVSIGMRILQRRYFISYII